MLGMESPEASAGPDAAPPHRASKKSNEMEDSKIIGKAGKMIRLVRVLRVMRIFKLVRHFQGLQAMLQTMREAYRDLSLLGALVATQTFLFSILVFVTEKDSDQEHSDCNCEECQFSDSDSQSHLGFTLGDLLVGALPGLVWVRIS